MRSKPWKTYLFWIALSEAVGLAAGLLTKNAVKLYTETVVKPPLSPPGAVFPIVWTALYALMGVGAARVDLSPPGEARRRGLTLFPWQLGFNFVWPFLFFRFQKYGLSFFWLMALLGLVLAMTAAFRKADLRAGQLQIPYALWLAFAGYLNAGVWLLNR